MRHLHRLSSLDIFFTDFLTRRLLLFTSRLSLPYACFTRDVYARLA